MEEVLSNQQARPGDATQLMHVIFSSDDEMMAFYLSSQASSTSVSPKTSW